MGAVAFLSQLRPNCDPSLHSTIDEIIEKLLRVPPSLFPPPPPPGDDLRGHTEAEQIVRHAGSEGEGDRENGSVVQVVTEAEREINSQRPHEIPTMFHQPFTPSPLTSITPHLSPQVTLSHPPPIPTLTASEGGRERGSGERKRLFLWTRLSLSDIHIINTTEKCVYMCVRMCVYVCVCTMYIFSPLVIY